MFSKNEANVLIRIDKYVKYTHSNCYFTAVPFTWLGSHEVACGFKKVGDPCYKNVLLSSQGKKGLLI